MLLKGFGKMEIFGKIKCYKFDNFIIILLF
jgi:hypothetical protein